MGISRGNLSEGLSKKDENSLKREVRKRLEAEVENREDCDDPHGWFDISESAV